jgi:hypothetical protein
MVGMAEYLDDILRKQENIRVLSDESHVEYLDDLLRIAQRSILAYGQLRFSSSPYPELETEPTRTRSECPVRVRDGVRRTGAWIEKKSQIPVFYRATRMSRSSLRIIFVFTPSSFSGHDCPNSCYRRKWTSFQQIECDISKSIMGWSFSTPNCSYLWIWSTKDSRSISKATIPLV